MTWKWGRLARASAAADCPSRRGSGWLPDCDTALPSRGSCACPRSCGTCRCDTASHNGGHGYAHALGRVHLPTNGPVIGGSSGPGGGPGVGAAGAADEEAADVSGRGGIGLGLCLDEPRQALRGERPRGASTGASAVRALAAAAGAGAKSRGAPAGSGRSQEGGSLLSSVAVRAAAAANAASIAAWRSVFTSMVRSTVSGPAGGGGSTALHHAAWTRASSRSWNSWDSSSKCSGHSSC